MCQPKPGPRCAAHTRTALTAATAALAEAQANGADAETIAARHADLLEARAAFDSTPTGQDALVDAITNLDPDERDQLANLLGRYRAAVATRTEQEHALREQQRTEAAEAEAASILSAADLQRTHVIPKGPSRNHPNGREAHPLLPFTNAGNRAHVELGGYVVDAQARRATSRRPGATTIQVTAPDGRTVTISEENDDFYDTTHKNVEGLAGEPVSKALLARNPTDTDTAAIKAWFNYAWETSRDGTYTRAGANMATAFAGIPDGAARAWRNHPRLGNDLTPRMARRLHDAGFNPEHYDTFYGDAPPHSYARMEELRRDAAFANAGWSRADMNDLYNAVPNSRQYGAKRLSGYAALPKDLAIAALAAHVAPREAVRAHRAGTLTVESLRLVGNLR